MGWVLHFYMFCGIDYFIKRPRAAVFPWFSFPGGEKRIFLGRQCYEDTAENIPVIN